MALPAEITVTGALPVRSDLILWVVPVQTMPFVPQGVPAAASKQAPWPSQPPALPQGALMSRGHSVAGSWPIGTGEQTQNLGFGSLQ